jgi:hypothetical protein
MGHCDETQRRTLYSTSQAFFALPLEIQEAWFDLISVFHLCLIRGLIEMKI